MPEVPEVPEVAMGRFGDRAAMADTVEQCPDLMAVFEGPELRMVAASASFFASM